MARYIRAESKPMWNSVILLGIPALLVAGALGMSGFVNFWAAIFLLTVGFAGLAYGLLSAPLGATRSLKLSGVAACVFAYLLLLWLLFVPAPLDTIVGIPKGNYLDGQMVLGLKWQSNYFPVNITVMNKTTIEYANINGYVQTSSPAIVRAAIYGGINQCIVTSENPAIDVSQGELSFEKNGKYVSIPVLQPDEQIPATIYRIVCAKLAPHSKVDVVVATAGEAKPSWAIVQFEYDAANRHRGPIATRQCFLSSCADMPTKIAEK
jgi:hypothetical protein